MVFECAWRDSCDSVRISAETLPIKHAFIVSTGIHLVLQSQKIGCYIYWQTGGTKMVISIMFLIILDYIGFPLLTQTVGGGIWNHNVTNQPNK